METPGIIGVDGGGSRCRFAALWRGTRIELSLGPANVTSDMHGALAVLRAGLGQLAARIGQPVETLHAWPSHLGLAGVTTPAQGFAVARALGLERAEVVEDWVPALHGAFDGADGTLAGVGTGSFVARRSRGAAHALGGWGFVLGDEASGAWIGRACLARALRVLDGIDPPSPLTDALLAEIGGAAGILSYVADAAPRDFARLAPRVFDAAEAGDAGARALRAGGAAYLAQAIRAAGWGAGEALCLSGGVGPRYAPVLPAEMAAALRAPRGSALDGALARAARLTHAPGT